MTYFNTENSGQFDSNLFQGGAVGEKELLCLY